MIRTFLIVLSLCLSPLTAQAGDLYSLERARYLMGTTLSLTLEGSNPETLSRAADQAFGEVERLESLYSNWRQDSEITRLNDRAGGEPLEISPEVYELLETSLEWSARTDGAFEVVLEPLVQAYDLRGSGRWPADNEIQDALSRTGGTHLSLAANPASAALTPGSGVELGGIGKGYALDRAAATLRREGVTAALLNFGGQILALGSPEGKWGWPVEVADPQNRERAAITVELRDASIATSSQYQRSLNTRPGPLGHVIDPRTGRPAPSWGSASAIAGTATDADALSTALFVMGADGGSAWLAHSPTYSGLFLAPTAEEGRLQIRMAGSQPGFRIQTDEGETGGPGGSGPPSTEELERRIDILSEEIEDLRQGEAAPETTISRYGLAPAASRVYGVKRGISIAGYGETVFSHFAETDESGGQANKKDRIDFLRWVNYFGYKFSDHVLFNSEIEIEHASSGKQGEVSVEFAYLDFLIRDPINIRAGLVLVPMGWINELHEPPVFLGVNRPEVERYILPATWRANGVGIFGERIGNFSYRAYVVESLRSVGDSSDGIGGYSASGGIRGGRQSGSKAVAENWAGVARVDWISQMGLAAGASVFSGGSAQGDTISDGSSFTGRTTIIEGHAEFRSRGFWARGLYAQSDVDEAEKINDANDYTGTASVGSRQFGWYLDAAYDIWRLWSAGSEMSLYPYVRYENFNTQESVPAGFMIDPKNDRQVWTLGAQYYPVPQVTLKADYQIKTNAAKTGVDQLNVGVSYLY